MQPDQETTPRATDEEIDAQPLERGGEGDQETDAPARPEADPPAEADPDDLKGLSDYPMPPGVSPELAQRIDAIAPARPAYVQTDEDCERWALAARTAAGIALAEGDGLSDAQLEQAAWHTARTLYAARDELPTGEPPADES